MYKLWYDGSMICQGNFSYCHKVAEGRGLWIALSDGKNLFAAKGGKY